MSKTSQVHSLSCGPLGTNAFIFGCNQTKECAIIDPGPESEARIVGLISTQGLTPKMILLTHTHWDHTADVAKLKKRYDLPVYVHKEDALNLEKPGSDQLPILFPIDPATPDHLVEEGDVIQLGNLKLEVLHTPGHSPGGVVYFAPSEEVLFSGDTLFQGTIGNLSLPTAEPDRIWLSLEKLAKLPGKTNVYPGHGEPTTIEKEPWLADAKNYFGF